MGQKGWPGRALGAPRTRGALQLSLSSLDKSRAWASGASETSVESAGLGEARRGTAGVKAWLGWGFERTHL